MRHLVTWTLLALAACGGTDETDTSEESDTDTDADTDADTDTDTDSDTDADGLRTLDNCGGSVDADVPEFFQKYFRCSDVSMDGDTVVVHTIGLPPHKSAYWPEGDPNHEEWDDRGGAYHQNPNRILDQDYEMRIAANPTPKGITVTSDLVDLTAQTSDLEYGMGPQGIAVDSVLIFNAVAAPGDDIRDEEYSFDTWSAHPAQGGDYHHHGPTKGPLQVIAELGLTTSTEPGSADIELYGIYCDGTVLLGCTELDGSTPSSADFDAQNGHVHDIVDEQGTKHFTGRYHAHVCAAYDHDFVPEIQYYEGCR
jgi:hypothetical protein